MPAKPVDLHKILTPAEDAEEIVPQKNREFQFHLRNKWGLLFKKKYLSCVVLQVLFVFKRNKLFSIESTTHLHLHTYLRPK